MRLGNCGTDARESTGFSEDIRKDLIDKGIERAPRYFLLGEPSVEIGLLDEDFSSHAV